MRKLFAVVALALLAACTEAPQELHMSSQEAAVQDLKQESGRRDRTAGQNEATRIYR